MNYSTAVFLINDEIRAVSCRYDPEDKHSLNYTFKTLDLTIAVNDLVVVPTDTRHGMTVVKVVEVDVDVDFDAGWDMKWIVSKIDMPAYESILEQEAVAIDAMKSAGKRRKREELRRDLYADNLDKIKALPIATINGDEDTTPPPPTHEYEPDF